MKIWFLLLLSVASKSSFYIISYCDKMFMRNTKEINMKLLEFGPANHPTFPMIAISQYHEIQFVSSQFTWACQFNITPTISFFYKKVRKWSNGTGIIWYHYWPVCEIEFNNCLHWRRRHFNSNATELHLSTQQINSIV